MIHQWCPFSSVLSVVAPPGGGRDDKDDNEKAQADTANNNKNDNDNDDDPHRKRQQLHKRLHLLARGVAWSAWMGFLLTQGVLGILWWFGSQADKNDKVVEESQGGLGIRIWIATTSSSSSMTEKETNYNWVRLEESPNLVQGLNLVIMAATFYIPLTVQLLYSMAHDCRSRQGHSRARTTTTQSSSLCFSFLPWSASRMSVLLFWCGAMFMGVFQQGLSAALGYMLHRRQGIMEEKEEQQEAGDTATILLLSTHLSVMAWIFWASWIPVLLERLLHYTCFYQAAIAAAENDTHETEEDDDTTESSDSSSKEEPDQDFFLREKQHELHQRLL